MDVYHFDPETILSFLLTLMRVSIVLFLFPVFNSANIPALVKGAVTMVITLAIWPHISLSGAELPAHPFDIGLLFLNEVILGFILGMCINFTFMGIQAGGEILGFQMGFSMISIADPMTGNQTGAIAFFLWMVSILTFLSLDGHLHLLKGFALSFKLIPAGGIVLSELLLRQVFDLAAQLFIIALKIAAPVMVSLFLVEITLGLISRTAPQVHVMEVGFPLKIAVGCFFLGLLLNVMAGFMQEFVTGMDSLFTNILRTLSPQFNK